MTLDQTITDLWHISRTALSGMSTVASRYDRMIYVRNELKNRYPELITSFEGSEKKLWFYLEEKLSPTF